MLSKWNFLLTFRYLGNVTSQNYFEKIKERKSEINGVEKLKKPKEKDYVNPSLSSNLSQDIIVKSKNILLDNNSELSINEYFSKFSRIRRNVFENNRRSFLQARKLVAGICTRTVRTKSRYRALSPLSTLSLLRDNPHRWYSVRARSRSSRGG